MCADDHWPRGCHELLVLPGRSCDSGARTTAEARPLSRHRYQYAWLPGEYDCVAAQRPTTGSLWEGFTDSVDGFALASGGHARPMPVRPSSQRSTTRGPSRSIHRPTRRPPGCHVVCCDSTAPAAVEGGILVTGRKFLTAGADSRDTGPARDIALMSVRGRRLVLQQSS